MKADEMPIGDSLGIILGWAIIYLSYGFIAVWAFNQIKWLSTLNLTEHIFDILLLGMGLRLVLSYRGD